MSGIERNPGPTSITKEDDDVIRAKLIDKYANQDTKDILAAYDSTHDWEQHVKQMTKLSVAKLRSASIELKIADADKIKKDDLAKKIVKRIQFLLPEICMYCEEQYTISPDETPLVCCYVCNHGAHMECIQDELRKINSSEDIFKMKGVVWICAECDAAQDDQAPPQKKHSVKFKQPIAGESEEAPVMVAAEDIGETDNSNGTNQNQPVQSRVEPPRNEENIAVCIHYKQGRCMYGISGNGCKYRHPKPCKKLLNHGIRGTNGCENGNQCEFLHPRMCRNSLFKKACFNSQCKDRHVRGTWKKVPGDGNTHPRPQNDRQPDANEHDAHNFLEIMKVLQSDMQQMNMQIQNLVRSHPANHQNPQQGQYWGKYPQQPALNQNQNLRNMQNQSIAFAMPHQAQYY